MRLALRVTPANIDERIEVEGLLKTVQAVTGGAVEVAFADQGYEGEKPAEAAAAQDNAQAMLLPKVTPAVGPGLLAI